MEQILANKIFSLSLHNFQAGNREDKYPFSMPRKRLPRGFYSPGSRGFIRVKNCELVEAKSSEREKVVVRLITDLRQFWTSLEVWSFIIFFFLSFLIVKYSDKFDRFEMKIWKWKSNDDANVVKYVTNRRAVSSNGELCFVDFWASQRLLED